MLCEDCQGKGVVELFTSVETCGVCEGSGRVAEQAVECVLDFNLKDTKSVAGFGIHHDGSVSRFNNEEVYQLEPEILAGVDSRAFPIFFETSRWKPNPTKPRKFVAHNWTVFASILTSFYKLKPCRIENIERFEEGENIVGQPLTFRKTKMCVAFSNDGQEENWTIVIPSYKPFDAVELVRQALNQYLYTFTKGSVY